MYFQKKQLVSSLLPVVLVLITMGMCASNASAQLDLNAKNAWQYFGQINAGTMAAGQTELWLHLGDVPAGKRLVVERITGYVEMEYGQRIKRVFLDVYRGSCGNHSFSIPSGIEVNYALGFIKNVGFNFDLTRRFYVDHQENPICGVYPDISFYLQRADGSKKTT